MKKLLAILLAAMMVFALTACGKNSNERAIVGAWQLVDTELETEYGLGIEFEKDGTLRYGFTEDVLAGITDGEVSDEALEGLDMLMKIEYKIKSDTEMEITVSAMFGLAKESDTVTYELNGDTLVFDGATYTRVK